MRPQFSQTMNRISMFRGHPVVSIILVSGVLTRVLYDMVSVQSLELVNWIRYSVGWGTGPIPYLGIYTAGTYMFSLAYRFWLSLPVDHPSFDSIYAFQGPFEFPQFQPTPANYVFSLSMKAPIVFFDILILILIAKVVESKTRSVKAAFLASAAWAWNPLVTLLENYNGIDITPAFFLLLAAYLYEKRKPAFVSVALMVGTLLRFGPALAVPPYLVGYFRRREWQKVLQLLVPAALVMGLAVSVYPDASGLGIFEALTQKQGILARYEVLAFLGPVLKPRLGLMWDGFIPFNLVLYFLLIALTSRHQESAGFGDQIASVLLAFFATSWFHFAFFLWLLPILTIENLGVNRRVLLYVLQTIAGLLWTVFQASTAVFSNGTSMFFIPVSPDLIPLTRSLATLQFFKGLEFIRAFLSGTLLVQLGLIVFRNSPED